MLFSEKIKMEIISNKKWLSDNYLKNIKIKYANKWSQIKLIFYIYLIYTIFKIQIILIQL